MQALLIANTGDDDPGYVGERLRQRGYDLDLGIGFVQGYATLGSDWSVYWEHVQDDVQRECALVRQSADDGVPLLGICYGGQLMSHALGGSVETADRVEIGWYEFISDDPALAPPGPWFEYHIDKFTAPPNAEILASSPAGPQAYRLGRMLALQFHPEVSPAIIRRWGSTADDDAKQYGIDFDGVYRESDQKAPSARERCHQLVDAFLDTMVPTT